MKFDELMKGIENDLVELKIEQGEKMTAWEGLECKLWWHSPMGIPVLVLFNNIGDYGKYWESSFKGNKSVMDKGV